MIARGDVFVGVVMVGRMEVEGGFEELLRWVLLLLYGEGEVV